MKILLILLFLCSCDFVRKIKVGKCYRFSSKDDVYRLDSRSGLYKDKFTNLKNNEKSTKLINNYKKEVPCY